MLASYTKRQETPGVSQARKDELPPTSRRTRGSADGPCRFRKRQDDGIIEKTRVLSNDSQTLSSGFRDGLSNSSRIPPADPPRRVILEFSVTLLCNRRAFGFEAGERYRATIRVDAVPIRRYLDKPDSSRITPWRNGRSPAYNALARVSCRQDLRGGRGSKPSGRSNRERADARRDSLYSYLFSSFNGAEALTDAVPELTLRAIANYLHRTHKLRVWTFWRRACSPPRLPPFA